VFTETAREHLVLQFDRGLAGWGLKHIAGVGADSGLTKADENDIFRMQAEGMHLIIHDLINVITLQHRSELRDVGDLQMPVFSSRRGLG
jgi:hypothetical protein